MDQLTLAQGAPRSEKRAWFFAPIEAGEWRALANWAIVWIVLANIAFASMWFIGAPPRFAEIAAAGAVGLIIRKAPAWCRYAAFIGVLAYSLLGFIAGLFNLAIGSLLHSMKFFLEINPANSIEYVIGAVLLMVICGLAWWQIKRPQGFVDTRLVLLAVVLILSLIAVDRMMGQGMRGHYMRTAEVGTPFTSASASSGFGVIAEGKPRNLMLIMVESMGGMWWCIRRSMRPRRARFAGARYQSSRQAPVHLLADG